MIKEAVRLSPKLFRKIFDVPVTRSPSPSQVQRGLRLNRSRSDLSAGRLNQVLPAPAVGRWLSDPRQVRKLYRDIIRTYRIPDNFNIRDGKFSNITWSDLSEQAQSALSSDLGSAYIRRMVEHYGSDDLSGSLRSARFATRAGHWSPSILNEVYNLFGSRAVRSNDVKVVPDAFKLLVEGSLDSMPIHAIRHELGHAKAALLNSPQYIKDSLAKLILTEPTRMSSVMGDPSALPWRKLLIKREIFNNEVLANIHGRLTDDMMQIHPRLTEVGSFWTAARNNALDTYRYQSMGMKNLPVLGEALKSVMNPKNARHKYAQSVIEAVANRTGKSVEEITNNARRIIDKLTSKYLGPDSRLF